MVSNGSAVVATAPPYLASFRSVMFSGSVSVFTICVSDLQADQTVCSGRATLLQTSAQQCDGTAWNRSSTCGDCTTDASRCVWCGDTNLCVPGSLTGPSAPYSLVCANWQVARLCFLSGSVVIIVVPTVCGALLLGIVLGIYCWCRRRSRRRMAKLDAEYDALVQQRNSRPRGTPITDAARARMAAKYGVPARETTRYGAATDRVTG